MYSIDFDNNFAGVDADTAGCNATKCWKREQFHWLQEDSCTATFVCSHMETNVCGDFGVVLGHPIHEDKNYCFPKEHYSQLLQTNDRLDIGIWYIREAVFSLRCYFWCTETGAYPAEPKPKVDGTFLERLVCTLRLVSVKFPINS